MSVDTVRGLNFGRFVNVFALAIAAFIFCRWLQRNSISTMESLLLTVFIFSMPTFQTQVILVNSFPHMVALIAAISAGLIAWRTKWSNGWGSLVSKYDLFTLALLLFATATYTPSAMFYYVVLSIPLIQLHGDDHFSMRRWMVIFSLPIFAGLIYFLFAKLTFATVPQLVQIPESMVGGHRVELTKDITKSFSLFARVAFAAFNLWNVVPSSAFALVVGFLTLLGVMGLVTNSIGTERMTSQQLKTYFHLLKVRGLFIVCLFPLSILPILVADYGWPSLRSISAMSALVVILVFSAIGRLASVFAGHKGLVRTLTLALLCIISVYHAEYNLQHFIVSPASKELQYVKIGLENHDFASVRRIHVIRPPGFNFLADEYQLPMNTDEFGFVTSANPANITGLIRCVLKELGLGPMYIGKIKISSSPYGKHEIKQDDKTIVLNMSKMYERLCSNY